MSYVEPRRPGAGDAEKEKRIDKQIGFYPWIGLSTLAVALTVYFFHFFFFNHIRTLSVKPDDWGTFGDFIGGLTNPIMALLALLALVQTIRLNVVEIRTTNDLQRQRNRIENASIRLNAQAKACEILYFRKIAPELSRIRQEDGLRMDAKIRDWANNERSTGIDRKLLNGLDSDIVLLLEHLKQLDYLEKMLHKEMHSKEEKNYNGSGKNQIHDEHQNESSTKTSRGDQAMVPLGDRPPCQFINGVGDHTCMYLGLLWDAFKDLEKLNVFYDETKKDFRNLAGSDSATDSVALSSQQS